MVMEDLAGRTVEAIRSATGMRVNTVMHLTQGPQNQVALRLQYEGEKPKGAHQALRRELEDILEKAKKRGVSLEFTHSNPKAGQEAHVVYAGTKKQTETLRRAFAKAFPKAILVNA